MDKRKIRIVDIAKKAGVSIGTVDRVIHNRGRVNPNTKELILRLLQESDYQPNLLARVLTSRIDTVIAVLIPKQANNHPFWMHPLIGIKKAESELKNFNVRIELFFFDQYDENDFDIQSQRILELKPNGVAIVPVFHLILKKAIEELDVNQIPYVFFNIDISNSKRICYIGQNAFANGVLAAKLMLYGIHTSGNVLILNSIDSVRKFSHLRERNEGFLSVFEKQNSACKISTFVRNIEDDFDLSIKNIFETTPEIIGIYVSDSKAYRIAKYLETINHKDVLLIGNDLISENILYLESGTIDFILSQRPEEQGYLSITKLFNHIHKIDPICKDILMPIDIFTKENYMFSSNNQAW